MMSAAQKLAFVHKMTHMALKMIPHYDQGGSVTANTQSGGGGIGNIGSLFTNQNGYQAQLAPTTQLDYTAPNATALTGINQGATQSQQLLEEQQGLAGRLNDQSLGRGPNPAQSALNENTGRNIASAASIAAGTRGAGSNPGLVALNAANTGADTQQNAVGQAATLQNQQELQATQALQAQQEAELGNIQGEQGIQGNLYGATANANNAQNNTAVSNYANTQQINAQTAQHNADAVNKGTQGLFSGVGGALTAVPGIGDVGTVLGGAGFAQGGEVLKKHPHLHRMAKLYYPHHFAEGGSTDFGVENTPAPAVNLTQSPSGDSSSKSDSKKSGGGLLDTVTSLLPLLALQTGGQVPGQPKVNHDAYSNDTVKAMLSPGEVVMDLDTLRAKGKLGKMARFVAKEIERKKAGRKLV